MGLRIYLGIIILLGNTLLAIAQVNIDKTDYNNLLSKSVYKVKDYYSQLSNLGDPLNSTNDKQRIKEEIYRRFDTQGDRVYNDIMPDRKTQADIAIEDYLGNVIVNYSKHSLTYSISEIKADSNIYRLMLDDENYVVTIVSFNCKIDGVRNDGIYLGSNYVVELEVYFKTPYRNGRLVSPLKPLIFNITLKSESREGLTIIRNKEDNNIRNETVTESRPTEQTKESENSEPNLSRQNINYSDLNGEKCNMPSQFLIPEEKFYGMIYSRLLFPEGAKKSSYWGASVPIEIEIKADGSIGVISCSITDTSDYRVKHGFIIHAKKVFRDLRDDMKIKFIPAQYRCEPIADKKKFIIKFSLYNSDEENRVYQFGITEPNFSGGENELINFINSNKKYPKNYSYLGKMIALSYVVDKNNRNITDIRILKGINKEYDDAAIETIKKLSGKYVTPAKKEGIPVHTRLTYSIPY